MRGVLKMREKRKNTRYISDIKTRYAFNRYNILGNFKQEVTGDAAIRDMSATGIGLRINDRLSAASSIVLNLTLKAMNSDISLIGKIVWKKQKIGYVSCGIKFEWLSNREAYSAYIKMLEQADGL